MRTTTVTCDICGAVITPPAPGHINTQLWQITIAISSDGQTYPSSPSRAADCCRACAVRLHLLGGSIEEQKARVEPLPTIEDLIRQIVREELP